VTQLWLLFRATRLVPIGVFIVGIEILVMLYGSFVFRIGRQPVQPVPIAVFAPVLISCCLAILCFSPQSGIDGSAARNLKPVVLTVLLIAFILAAIGLATATYNLAGDLTSWGACRDLAGFFGFALLGVALLGAAWFWTLPVLAATIPMIGLSGDGLVGLVTWPLRPDRSAGANAVAMLLLVSGIAAVATGQLSLRKAT
jgi:hypothetical protein